MTKNVNDIIKKLNAAQRKKVGARAAQLVARGNDAPKGSENAQIDTVEKSPIFRASDKKASRPVKATATLCSPLCGLYRGAVVRKILRLS